jgi:single-strand DNA-binding protein
MDSLNRVLLMGNLTKDPELRHLPSGVPLVDLRIAVSEKYTNRAGEDVESVCYVDVVAWRAQAEACDRHLFKGSPVMVEGRFQFDQWEKNGEKRNRLCVRADRVQFMGSTEPKQESVYAEPVEPAGELSSADPLKVPSREDPVSPEAFDDTVPPF